MLVVEDLSVSIEENTTIFGIERFDQFQKRVYEDRPQESP